MIKLFCIIASVLVLQGCSSYQDNFDCPAGVGVGCKSVSQVDQLVEKGIIGPDSNHHRLRIWFAPYQDIHGNIHSESVIFTQSEDKDV